MSRLFFALLPGLEQSSALTEWVSPLVAQAKAVPVPPENLHATLCFVGEVVEEQVGALRAAAASMRAPSVSLCFDMLERWEKPRILCATASESPTAASELAMALATAALAAGFSPDLKPFRAHLTLGRKVSAEAAAPLNLPRQIPVPLRLRCEQFVLMQSRREESRSIYSVVDRWLLDSGETQCLASK